MKLGVYPALSLAAARTQAFNLLGAVQRGEDPAEDRRRDHQAGTFEELAELYLERHARPYKKPASIKEDTRILNTYLLPAWRRRKFAPSHAPMSFLFWTTSNSNVRLRSWPTGSRH